MKTFPNARSTNIVVKELIDEVLIYDIETHRAYNLNKTSKIIYQACDGRTCFEEIKQKHKFTDDLIYLALDELEANRLLEDYKSDYFAGISRREAIRKAGLSTMLALPLISALLAPTAAMAQSVTCRSGQGPNDPNGVQGSGQNCICYNGSGAIGFRPCNTSRGGNGSNPSNGCRAGCACQPSVSGDGPVPGTCG